MSLLIQPLNQIMTWLEQNIPEYAQSFQPGLSVSMLTKISETLGFSLPPELYDLYQWHNGTPEVGDIGTYLGAFHFSPLEEIVQIYQEDYGGIDGDFFILENGCPLFPFSENQGRYYSITVPQDSSQEAYNIVVTLTDGDHYIVYESLVSMMNTLAECYETKAFYLDEEGNISEHSEQVIALLKKHNASVLDPQLSFS
jgi:SMI1 / KNR4 family (SUKH-1)